MKIFNSMEAAVQASTEGGGSRSYVAAKDGFLKVVEVGGPTKPIHAVFASPSKTPDLEVVQPQIVLKTVVPIPALLIAKAAAIFRHVYDEYNGAEMICLLRWKEEDFGDGRKIGRYYLDRAERVEIAAGGLDYHQHVPIVGTLHSHGSGSAFFSATDDKWEKEDTPGIYITIGNVNQPVPSIEASIAGHGNRVKMPVPDIPKEVFESVILTDEEKKWWTATLTVKPYSRTEGYYIVVGQTITGWSPNTTASLHEGEKILPVKEYKPKKEKKTRYIVRKEKTDSSKVLRLREVKKDEPIKVTPSLGHFMRMSKFIHFLRDNGYLEDFIGLFLNGAEDEEIEIIEDALAGEADDQLATSVVIPTEDRVWMSKCIYFILKRGYVADFFDMFLKKAKDDAITEVSNQLDMFLDEGKEEEEEEEKWPEKYLGGSRSSGAAGSDITSERQWGEFWRD